MNIRSHNIFIGSTLHFNENDPEKKLASTANMSLIGDFRSSIEGFCINCLWIPLVRVTMVDKTK